MLLSSLHLVKTFRTTSRSAIAAVGRHARAGFADEVKKEKSSNLMFLVPVAVVAVAVPMFIIYDEVEDVKSGKLARRNTRWD
jgi:hypothetical protein